MKEMFEYILRNYLPETENEFKNNTVANYLRDAREIIENKAAIDTAKYKIEGSPGKGRWVTVPWIGIFDKRITTTATKGYYIVYLFRADMSGVYLSLNQGWTFFENNYKDVDRKERIRIVSLVADNLRKKLNSTLNDFSDEKIDLMGNYPLKGTKYKLPKGYEAGHICGKFYPANKIPEDNELINDLRDLIGVYRELVGIVGTDYERIVKEFLSQDPGYEPRKIPLKPINIDLEDQAESTSEKTEETIPTKKNSYTRNLKEINLKETEEKEREREKQLITYLKNDERQERANKLHSETLKILAIYLRSQKLVPKESVIDLLAENKNKAFIFEVKSIHTDNFTYQTRSAIGQLLQYEYFEVKSNPSFEGMEIYKGIVYSKEPPKESVEFLEAYDFGVYWINNNAIDGSEESMNKLRDFLN